MTESTQIRAVGVEPTLAHLFVGACLFSTPAEACAVCKTVQVNDFDEPARTVFTSVKSLAAQGVPPSPQLVLDDIKRHGQLTRSRGIWLASATASGACASAARSYAAALVAESLRRQTECFGQALVSAAASASEPDVSTLADVASSRIRAITARLKELRGDVDA